MSYDQGCMGEGALEPLTTVKGWASQGRSPPWARERSWGKQAAWDGEEGERKDLRWRGRCREAVSGSVLLEVQCKFIKKNLLASLLDILRPPSPRGSSTLPCKD